MVKVIVHFSPFPPKIVEIRVDFALIRLLLVGQLLADQLLVDQQLVDQLLIAQQLVDQLLGDQLDDESRPQICPTVTRELSTIIALLSLVIARIVACYRLLSLGVVFP